MIQMKLLKTSLAVAALLMLTAGPALARPMSAEGQAPAGTPPATQAPTTPPPATQPPATQPTMPAPKAQLAPPAPFPQGAKIAFVNIPAIAQNSAAGKEATKKLSDLNTKKVAEINDRQKQLQAMQTKLGQGGGVLNETARAQLEKDIDKLQRDIQFAQQNAQAEMNELQTDLQGEFQQKLIPVIKQVAEEKGLHAVFSISDSGVAYYDPGLDISEEVVKRLDTAKPAAPVKK